jgi:hypothetical protein
MTDRLPVEPAPGPLEDVASRFGDLSPYRHPLSDAQKLPANDGDSIGPAPALRCSERTPYALTSENVSSWWRGEAPAGAVATVPQEANALRTPRPHRAGGTSRGGSVPWCRLRSEGHGT